MHIYILCYADGWGLKKNNTKIFVADQGPFYFLYHAHIMSCWAARNY